MNIKKYIKISLLLLAFTTAASFVPSPTTSALKCSAGQNLDSDNLCWAVASDVKPVDCKGGKVVGGKCMKYAGLPQNNDGSAVSTAGIVCSTGYSLHDDGKCWKPSSYKKVVGKTEQTCRGVITGQDGWAAADFTGEAHWDNGSCWVVADYHDPQNPLKYDASKNTDTGPKAEGCVPPELIANATDPLVAQAVPCNPDGSDPRANQNQNSTTTTPGRQPGDAGQCGEARTNLINCGTATGTNAIANVLKIVLFIMTILIGIVATGGIVYGAVLYASASDNSSQVSQAKTIIRDVVIGLFLYGFMVVIINWLVPGGVIG